MPEDFKKSSHSGLAFEKNGASSESNLKKPSTRYVNEESLLNFDLAQTQVVIKKPDETELTYNIISQSEIDIIPKEPTIEQGEEKETLAAAYNKHHWKWEGETHSLISEAELKKRLLRGMMEEAFKDTGKTIVKRDPLEYKGRAATIRPEFEREVAATLEESFSQAEEKKVDSPTNLFEAASKTTKPT